MVIVIEDWMIESVGLSGTELLVFALIHGCSQKGDGCWHGGYDNLAKRTGSTKKTVIDAVSHLIERGMVTKSEAVIGKRKKAILMSIYEPSGVEITPLHNSSGVEITPVGVLKLHSPPHPPYNKNIKQEIDNSAYAHVDSLFDNTAPSPTPSPASPFLLSSLEKDMCHGSPTFVVQLKRGKVAKILSEVAKDIQMPEEEQEKFLDWYCEPVSEGSPTVRAETMTAFTVKGSAKRWMEKRRDPKVTDKKSQPLSDYYKGLMQEMNKRFSYGPETSENPDEQ